MIYLTNDIFDQGVYFDFRTQDSLRRSAGTVLSCVGLVGNGIHEVPVSLKQCQDSLEVVFARSELFTVVDEDVLRGMVEEVVLSTVH